MNDKLNAVLLVLVFIGGAGVGAIAAIMWAWWQLVGKWKERRRRLNEL